MAITIMLDAGHGGFDNGASYENRLEKNDNLALTMAVGKILSDYGYNVLYTRETDRYDSPVRKANIANEQGADYFVSFHRNDSVTPNQYNGVQSLVFDRTGVKNNMAKNMNAELEKVGFNNINVEARPDLAVLRRTEMPAVLVEAGFINSDKDNALWDQKFNEIAEAIAKGIDETLKNTDIAITEEAKKRTKSKRDNEDELHAREYEILIGVYRGINHAYEQVNRLKAQGYPAIILEDDGMYQVRIGDYIDVEEAKMWQRELRDKGFDTLIVWKV